MLAAIAASGCSDADDASGSDWIMVPSAGAPPTGGMSAGGLGGGGAGGMGPMPGMVMMDPERDAAVPLGGTGGAPSDAGVLDSGVPPVLDSGTQSELDASAADAGEIPEPVEDECGVIPSGALTASTSGAIDDYGTIEYDVHPPNEVIALRTTMRVPEEPPPYGTVFLWPGLQPLPGSANYTPIRNGVLQPVLTWGPSCVPGALDGHDTWWISPVYVNISSTDFDYRGCLGGPVIEVQPDSLLDIEMWLEGTAWIQAVHDLTSDETTEFTLDLGGQGQARALFVIELPDSAKPTEDIVFTHSVFSMKESEPEACEVLRRGSRDYASQARVSPDGKHCCIDHIILRARDVPATTMDP